MNIKRLCVLFVLTASILVAFIGIQSKPIYSAADAAPSLPASSKGGTTAVSSKGAGNVAALRIALYPSYLRGQPLDTLEQNALVLEGFVFLFLGSVWYWKSRSKVGTDMRHP
jgi:hypothetical protein